MKPSQFIMMSGIVLLGALIAGCAAGSTQPYATTCGHDYACMSDRAFQYRQQAMQLSALAERYEIEAETKAKEIGQDAEQVNRQHELAKKLWADAQEADDLALQYRRQLPHNVIN